MRQLHTFDPVYGADSRILILGSFPSERSRAEGFYYGHPSNRFWTVLAGVLERPKPVTIEEKKSMLLEAGIALWDVIERCDITGSSDSSIRDVVPNDIAGLLLKCDISRIYANGGTACRLYRKYVLPETGIDIEPLPSTSPANAAYSVQRLMEAWSRIKAGLYENV